MIERLFIITSARLKRKINNCCYITKIYVGYFSIVGVPDPPTNLTLSPNCGDRTTTISWEPGAANDAAITHFLIEQKASFPGFPDSPFEVIENVTNPGAKSYPLDLPGAATLFFRMRAVNSFGPSRASFQTTRLCRTDGAGV